MMPIRSLKEYLESVVPGSYSDRNAALEYALEGKRALSEGRHIDAAMLAAVGNYVLGRMQSERISEAFRLKPLRDLEQEFLEKKVEEYYNKQGLRTVNCNNGALAFTGTEPFRVVCASIDRMKDEFWVQVDDSAKSR
jgi:hypothetical protein